jgi:hypothetical protein
MAFTNYDLLTVPDAAELLETKDTFVYGLIRKGIIVPATREPQLKISYPTLVAYLKRRIPSSFELVAA